MQNPILENSKIGFSVLVQFLISENSCNSWQTLLSFKRLNNYLSLLKKQTNAAYHRSIYQLCND